MYAGRPGIQCLDVASGRWRWGKSSRGRCFGGGGGEDAEGVDTRRAPSPSTEEVAKQNGDDESRNPPLRTLHRGDDG
jgi:hypothetical protein